MKKQYMIPTVLAATLMLGIMTVNAFDNTLIDTNKITSKDAEELKESIPKTFEETNALIAPIRSRFLLWTHDGRHIMWGFYGNGHFTGIDNLGKRAWGIYGGGYFAGFYDGEMFLGKYRNGYWKAIYLFNEKIYYGRYVTFPAAVPVITAEAVK